MSHVQQTICPFHLAFPVDDLEAAREFYEKTLECPLGRRGDRWIDFDLYGHQIVAHLVDHDTHVSGESAAGQSNQVDKHDVPVPHFGVVLPWDEWHEMSNRLKKNGIKFLIEPHVRFEGEIGEQATMFFLDPAGNALEFKSFRDLSQMFAH